MLHSLHMLLRLQVRSLLAGLTKEKGSAAIDSAYSTYTYNWGSHPEQAVVKKTVADIETDFLFLVPTQIALQLHADHSRSDLFLKFHPCLSALEFRAVSISRAQPCGQDMRLEGVYCLLNITPPAF